MEKEATNILKEFIQVLYLELQTVKEEDIQNLFGPVEEGEEILGSVSDDIRKLSALSVKLGKERDQLGVDIKWSEDIEARKEMIKTGNKLNAKYKFYRELLFISVRDYFGIWDKGLGLRENFVAVAYEPKNRDNPFLRLFGLEGD